MKQLLTTYVLLRGAEPSNHSANVLTGTVPPTRHLVLCKTFWRSPQPCLMHTWYIRTFASCRTGAPLARYFVVCTRMLRRCRNRWLYIVGRCRRLRGASKVVDRAVWCRPERWRMTRKERGSTEKVDRTARALIFVFVCKYYVFVAVDRVIHELSRLRIQVVLHGVFCGLGLSGNTMSRPHRVDWVVLLIVCHVPGTWNVALHAASSSSAQTHER